MSISSSDADWVGDESSLLTGYDEIWRLDDDDDDDWDDADEDDADR